MFCWHLNFSRQVERKRKQKNAGGVTIRNDIYCPVNNECKPARTIAEAPSPKWNAAIMRRAVAFSAAACRHHCWATTTCLPKQHDTFI